MVAIHPILKKIWPSKNQISCKSKPPISSSRSGQILHMKYSYELKNLIMNIEFKLFLKSKNLKVYKFSISYTLKHICGKYKAM